MFVLYGVLRDIPVPTDCGDDTTDGALLSAYRSGSVAIFVAAELLTAGIYMTALRTGRPRSPRSAPLLAAALGLLTALPLWGHEPSNHVILGSAVALAAAAIVLATSRAAARVPGWSWPQLYATFAAGALEAVLAVPAAFAAVYLTAPTLVIASAIAILLLLRADRKRNARSLAHAALYFAVVLLPMSLLVIQTRGDQPILC
jgi:hypothetical protein